MSEQKLRALLAEARELLQDVAFACRGLRPLSDAASTVVGPLFRQRDEARAEVGRLTRELEEVHRARVGVERAAYRRGAKAMREAAAQALSARAGQYAERISVMQSVGMEASGSLLECRDETEAIKELMLHLPIPEDKP